MPKISYKQIILFSLPSIWASLLEPVAAIVDTSFVGHIGSSWVSALAINSIIFGSLTWIFNFIIHTSTQSIASLSIVEDRDLLLEQIKITLMSATFIGVFVFLAMFLGEHLLLQLAGTPSEILTLVSSYYRVRLIFHPALILLTALIAILRGLALVGVSFFIVALTTLINIGCNWFFLFYLHGDISGAAWGTGIANVVGVLIACGYLIYYLKLDKSFFYHFPRKKEWFTFGSNSIHLFGRSATLSGVFFLSTRTAAHCGVIELAAYQIALQVWLFASFLTDGFAITANIYTSKLLVIKDRIRLKIFIQRLLLIGGGIGCLLAISYLVGTPIIWKLFTNDARLMTQLSLFWPLIGWSQIPNAMTYVLDGVLFGFAAFSFLRTHIIVGAILFFTPLAIVAYSQQSVIFLWWGLIVINIYRGISSGWFVWQNTK